MKKPFLSLKTTKGIKQYLVNHLLYGNQNIDSSRIIWTESGCDTYWKEVGIFDVDHIDAL